jgi:iron complex outermembrane receptor protein
MRAAFLTSVAFTGVIVLSPAQAQTQSAAVTAVNTDAEGGLEEIVVTAQKTETNLQKTPISISVMSTEDLINRHAQSLEDLGDGSIPSLRVAPFFARSSALTIGMRGIGSLGDANQPARDQAVGVYVDGVYLGRAQGLGSALFDVERIEVLKGPQGTLFGRNTEGGAISIVTRAPSGAFRSSTTAGYSNYDGYKAETHLDLPSFNNISLKFDGVLSKRDGTVGNPTTSGQPNFNSYDKRGFHAQALWNVSDDFSADYSFDVSKDGTTPYYVQLLAKGALALAPLAPLQPERADRANVGAPMRESIGDTSGHRLTLDWNPLSDLEVKSVTSFRGLRQSQFDNAEAALSVYAPNGAFSRYSLARVQQHQSSEELQVLGKYDDFQFVVGGFYYHEFVRDNAQTPNSLQWNANGTAYTTLSLNLDTVPYDRASHVTTNSYAAFGQVVWTPPVLDGITHLTAGGRYTRDSKKGSLDIVNGALPTYVDANKNTVTGVIPLDASWDRFDPMVNLAVDVAPDINLYGRWSTAYKAGGANSRSLTYRAFDPETVSMFEIGAKTQFWDNHARLNVAAYTGTLKKVQVDFNVIILNNNRGTLETTNAATGKTKGLEASFTVNPFLGLTLSADYTYTHVDLSQAFNPFINAQSKIYELYTPRHAGSVAADYEWPLESFTLGMHLDGNLAGRQYTSSTDPTLSDKSFVTNGRVALSDMQIAGSDAKFQVALWARNLLSEQHTFLKNTNASLGTYGIFNEPRTFGIEGNVRF